MRTSVNDIRRLVDVLNDSIDDSLDRPFLFYLTSDKRGDTIYWTLHYKADIDSETSHDISKDVTMKIKDMHYYLQGILTAVNGHLIHEFSV